MVTGLGMGEIRTALEIKKNEGLQRKCWWGPWWCTDELEGTTIEPDNLYPENISGTSFPVVPIASGIGAGLAVTLSALFVIKRKKE